MWSLATARQTRHDAPSDEPLLIVDDRVTGATADVLEAGVSIGMLRREAEALAPFATVLTRDLGDEIRRFEPVVTAVEDLVPRVEVVGPGLIYVPVDGAVRYYGSEEDLARRVQTVLHEASRPPSVRSTHYPQPALRVGSNLKSHQPHIGIADGPFAARWAAASSTDGEPVIVTDTIGFLSGLDLGTLRESMGGEEMIETFRWLGITTLGDLARLPRDTMASRFGNHGVLAHRLASGEDRPVDAREIPVEMGVEMSFEDPLESLDAVAFAGRNLAEKLLAQLRPAGVAPHTVTITAEAASGPSRSRVWRSADPFTEKALEERVWWQLRAWVETAGVPGGIVHLGIHPADMSDEGRQLGLFTDESSMVEVERALARAQALLGPDGVLQARAQGGRMPGERVTWSRWGEPETAADRSIDAPWPGSTPAPAPALVPGRLQQIEVEWEQGTPSRVRFRGNWEPVLTWSGPWRLSGRWWSGDRDADRYQLVTSMGAFLCVVSQGRVFLAGVYD